MSRLGPTANDIGEANVPESRQQRIARAGWPISFLASKTYQHFNAGMIKKSSWYVALHYFHGSPLSEMLQNDLS